MKNRRHALSELRPGLTVSDFKSEGLMMPTNAREAWVPAYLEDVFNGHNAESLENILLKARQGP